MRTELFPLMVVGSLVLSPAMYAQYDASCSVCQQRTFVDFSGVPHYQAICLEQMDGPIPDCGTISLYDGTVTCTSFNTVSDSWCDAGTGGQKPIPKTRVIPSPPTLRANLDGDERVVKVSERRI
jgi:hypothetical protein